MKATGENGGPHKASPPAKTVTVAFAIALCVAVSLSNAPFCNAATAASRPRNRVMEPAFENAGRSPGLEIWRIENFKPVAYPKKDYGKFYTGDSYIVLSTKQNKRGDKSWDLHFWLGQETSQDEAGAAAILSVQLDDSLGGAPIQYREVQEHESQLFLSHFKNGVRYLPGGVSSGFTHVDRNAIEKRLFQIKGKRNIRVKQVDFSIASMNKGDCFILDAVKEIYVYVGQKSKRVERLKAISAANNLRDQDHGGRSRIHVIDEFSSEDEVEKFFAALGGGSASDIPDESAGGDDADFESSQEHSISLHRVSDASGNLKVEKVNSKPLEQSALDTNDCFILETGDSNIFVWVGKKCNNKEKTESMKKAEDFLKSKHYPSWTQVVRVVEGGEPSYFQQYFRTWRNAGELHSRLIRATGETPAPKLDVKSAGEAAEFMPDDGSGEVEIYRVEDFELAPVPEESYGKFFGGDSYVIKYRYGGNKYIIYMWQGNKSSIDEKAASAIHAVRLDNELNGKAIQIRLTQDHESKHFLHIFKGKFVSFLGGHASGFKNVKDYDSYVEGETRLFRVRGTTEDNVRASQQVARGKSLESDDVFIVEHGDKVWIWIGKDSDQVEQDLAKGFVEHITPGANPVEVEEGNEPEEFWEALGGKEDYKDSFENDLKPATDPRLYHVQLIVGWPKFEELYDFEQRDLNEDDIMLLDNGVDVFAWVGSGSSDEERKSVHKVSQRYLSKYDRQDAVAIAINQGEEPEAFTAVFPNWDPELWERLTTYSETKRRMEDFNDTIAED